jgi:type IV secretory pathway TraG/TraD family ATPase VirD4
VLDAPLLQLSDRDEWTWRDAVGHTVILGSPGSGKSSGPGRNLISGFLSSGAGGMVLCAKPGEAAKWLGYCEQAGRRDDVIRFSPEHTRLRFNPLDFELRRTGRGAGYTQNATALFAYLLELIEGGSGKDGQQDKFWQRAVTELLSWATDVLLAAGEPVSLPAIYRLIQSCPRRDGEVDEFYDDVWRDSSFCFQCLARAAAGDLTQEAQQDLEAAATYLCEELPRLAEQTRASILATFKGMALPFLRSPMREVFGTDTTLRLEDSFEAGKIILVDYPLREFGEVGRLVGGMMKYFYMAAVERRAIHENAPPCFLFIDEFQDFLSPYDAKFLATARESRCACVLLTQNISNLYAQLSAANAKSVVDALLGNCTTKILCANADAITNRWAADLIAQTWQSKASSSTNSGQQMSQGTSIGQQLAYQVLPAEFSTLQKGGPPDWTVETVFFQGGRVFKASGQTYSRIAFRQMTD